MTRLLLVRHGSTEWNEDGRRQGHQDVPLSRLGYAQASRLAQRLEGERIDRAYSSDLSRAQETARLILESRNLSVEVDARLRECCFGEWEGLRHDEIARRFPTAWAAWTTDPVLNAPTCGESFQAVALRLSGAMAEITGDPLFHTASPAIPAGWPTAPEALRTEVVLVVTHGAAIAVLLTRLLGLDLARYWQFAIRPASLTVLDLYPAGAIASVIGGTWHLAGLR